MSNTHILAFGEIMMRLMVPDYKKLYQSRELEYIFSGTGLNVLGALNKLGHKVRILTRLPNNTLGESAKFFISGMGIDTSEVSIGGEYMGTYFLEKGFGIRGSVVTYGDRTNSSFYKSNISHFNIERALNDVKLIHICGISLAASKEVRNIILALLKEGRKKGAKIIFDFNYRNSLWNSYDEAKTAYMEILKHVDIVFANDMDATNIFSYKTSKITKKEKTIDLLSKMAKDFKLEYICGTLRDKENISQQKLIGYLISDDSFFFSREYEFPVYDRIGAGDAFTAGIIHGILNNKDIEEAIEFATCSAVLAHTTYGDTPICNLSEIEDFKNGLTKDMSR